MTSSLTYKVTLVAALMLMLIITLLVSGLVALSEVAPLATNRW